jgi:hypothetical protein
MRTADIVKAGERPVSTQEAGAVVLKELQKLY